jgi:hypothetical protein
MSLSDETLPLESVTTEPDHPLVRPLDEAFRLLEMRRYRRLARAYRLPAQYAVVCFLMSLFVVPFLAAFAFPSGGGFSTPRFPAGWVGSLWLTAGGAAALAAYWRALYLWQQQRQAGHLQTWLLTSQSAAQVVRALVVMPAFFGLGMIAIPFLVGLLVLAVTLHPWWQLLLPAPLLAACALLGAAAGSLAFFAGQGMVRTRDLAPVLLLPAALVLGVWGWLEFGPASAAWFRLAETTGERIVHAGFLATPAAALYALGAPERWPASVLGAVTPGLAALFFTGFMGVVALAAARAAQVAFAGAASEAERWVARPQAVEPEAGSELYWQGFRNPVLTRDIRTRLRSKETIEFVFFASVAVAAGAFVPLLIAAGELGDPIAAARSARYVFFWLSMTLVALTALVGPGLTADGFAGERAAGTLEMLIGSPLRAGEILGGKLVGAILVVLLLISPSLPLFGLCHLFHGAEASQVAAIYLVVLVTAVVSCLIGLTQAAINHRAGAAKFFAYFVTALFVALPAGPFWLAAAVAAPEAALRDSLMGGASVAPVMFVVWTFVLVLFWGNASEQMDYVEF